MFLKVLNFFFYSLILPIGLLTGSLSCGSSEIHSVPPGSNYADLKVVGGIVVSNNEPSEILLSSVGLTTQKQNMLGKTFCSAVIISHRILLTAAHCVEKYRIDSSANLLNLMAVFGNKENSKSDSRKSAAIRVRGIAIHKEYRQILSREKLEKHPANDIALLYLTKPIGMPFKPVRLVRTQESVSYFSHIVIAGFGVTGGLISDDSGILRAVDVSKIYENPLAKTIELEGPVLDGKRIAENDDGSYSYQVATGGSCGGDSGGPAYVWTNSGFKLLGITAFGDSQRLARNPDGPSYCVGGSFVTDLRYYERYILNAANSLEKRMGESTQVFVTTF